MTPMGNRPVQSRTYFGHLQFSDRAPQVPAGFCTQVHLEHFRLVEEAGVGVGIGETVGDGLGVGVGGFEGVGVGINETSTSKQCV